MSWLRNIMLSLLVLAAASAYAVAGSDAAGEIFDADTINFSRQVDNSPLSLLAVQYKGRTAILDTLARQEMRQIHGRSSVSGTSPAFSYLELQFNRQCYLSRPLIYIGEASLRRQLLQGGQDQQSTRYLAPGRLMSNGGAASRPDSLLTQLDRLSSQPEMRLPLERLASRMQSFLADRPLPVIPGEKGEWLTEEEAGQLAKTGPAASTVKQLRQAWLARDAGKVNQLLAELHKAQKELGGKLPGEALRRTEQVYNRSSSGTIVFIGFAAATVLLLMTRATRSRWLRHGAWAVYSLSAATLLAVFIVRWLLSARAWYLPPIMNQFEAVTASALLAVLLAGAIELIWRRGVFMLAAALYATAALLAGFLLPETMSAGISAGHGILNSPLMAAHVAVIIIGHAMVGMSFVISLLYLLQASFMKAGERKQASLAGIDGCNVVVVQLAAWTVSLGTILGALWGDVAWGRWWGWDIKETWALITAIMFIAILHVRLVVPPQKRGLVTALGCIVGTLVMLFNWIVVNYLMTGMHSYA